MSRELIIGGLKIPVHASMDLQQEYRTLSARTLHRMATGSGRMQIAWDGKLATDISGRGIFPPGLEAVDDAAELTLSCIAARALYSVSNAITLPAARRSDAGSEPYGLARIGDRWVQTGIGIVGDLATLTPVAGADLYQAAYYPELQVLLPEPPRELVDDREQVYGWTLTAEEV